MMKLARLVLMLFLMTAWAAAQTGAPASTDKKDSPAPAGKNAMSCCCCQHMAHAADKDAAKSEAKSEGGMMAGGMGCCAKMGQDKGAAGGMSCGKNDDSPKADTPEQKMK